MINDLNDVQNVNSHLFILQYTKERKKIDTKLILIIIMNELVERLIFQLKKLIWLIVPDEDP